MTAWKFLMPNMPRFDTAEVPPWYSSGFSLRARARAAKSFISLEITDSVLVSAARTTGRDQPAGDRHRHADIGSACASAWRPRSR